jgi:hypothetical protein
MGVPKARMAQGSVEEDYGEIGLESFVRKNTPHFQKEPSAPIGTLQDFLCGLI